MSAERSHPCSRFGVEERCPHFAAPSHFELPFPSLPPRAGETDQALKLLDEALDNASKHESKASSSPSSSIGSLTSKYQQLTLSYNKARLQEASGNYLAAKQAYQVQEMVSGKAEEIILPQWDL